MQQATLLDEAGKTVESRFIGNTVIECGAELEWDVNLINVEEQISSSPASQTVS